MIIFQEKYKDNLILLKTFEFAKNSSIRGKIRGEHKVGYC